MKKTKANIIIKSELAKRLGVSPPAISKYIRQGMPVRADGRIDYRAAKKWHAANVVGKSMLRGRVPVSKPKQANPSLRSLAETKIQRERVRLEKEELELERAKGAVVDRSEVSGKYAALIVQFRNRALRLPTTLAPRVAAETDTSACQRILEGAIREALQELADAQ
jgi:hypothetical protein